MTMKFVRSCEVVNHPKKHPTSLVRNNNLTKNSRSYRGCHISNNITSISEELQRCYKLLKLLIYKVCKPTSEKVFGALQKSCELMHVGRQDSTNQPLSLQFAVIASTPEVQCSVPAHICILLGAWTKLIPQTTGFQKQ